MGSIIQCRNVTKDYRQGSMNVPALRGVDLNEINRYSPNVDAVTVDQVRAMAGQVIDPSRATLVIAGDAKAFEAALKAKYPQAEIIPAAQLNLDSPTLR